MNNNQFLEALDALSRDVTAKIDDLRREMRASYASLDAKMESTEQALSSTQGAVGSIGHALVTMQQAVHSMQQAVGSMQQSVGSMQQSVGSMHQALTDVEIHSKTNRQEIFRQQHILDEGLASVGDQFKIHRKNIAVVVGAVVSDVGSLKSDIEQLKLEQNRQASRIDALEDKRAG